MMSTETSSAPQKRFKVPHTCVILFTMIILAAIGTYVITPGSYTREKDERTGRTLVDPESYHHVERTPTTIFGLFNAVPRGMVATATIVVTIFVCGGAFSIMRETGAVDAGVARIIMKMRGREKLMIPLTMLLFAILGASLGLAEEVIVFIPIGVAISRAIGYDNIIAVAMMSTGAAVGFSSGMLNTYTTGVAQSIAELPLFSGLWFRAIGFVILYITGVVYTMRYAARIKDDPTQGYLYGVAEAADEVEDSLNYAELVFTKRHGAVMLTALALVAYLTYGILYKGYYLIELATVFMAIGIFTGLVGGVSPSNIGRAFIRGCGDVVFGAMVVGISRGILIVMEGGNIIDTIVHWLASVIGFLPGGLAAIGMFLVQTCLNFFIPSGSGLAATTMPIMTPLADMLEITRQTAVVAFHYGDGFTNQIIPTSGALMAVLAVAKVPYEKWFRFIWPLMVIWTTVGAIMCFAAATMHLGPF